MTAHIKMLVKLMLKKQGCPQVRLFYTNSVSVWLRSIYAQKIADGRAIPHWDLALGRKCCVPTEFIGQGLYALQEEALQRANLLAEQKNRAEIFRVLDGKHEGEQMLFPDVPQSFGPGKLYSERTITIVRQF